MYNATGWTRKEWRLDSKGKKFFSSSQTMWHSSEESIFYIKV
jgi:hypothetical protein